MYKMRPWGCLFAVTVLFAIIAPGYSISCVNSAGHEVDWWLMIKVPVISNSSISVYRSGYGYMYMDNTRPEFLFSNVGLDQAQDPLAATLKRVLPAEQNVAYAMYNDERPQHPKQPEQGEQCPDEKEEDRDVHAAEDGLEAPFTLSGHTKGVVAYDNNRGFWLVHSVPRFPDAEATYSFPAYERIYGQSFLCMTLGLDTLKDVGDALQYNNPIIYASKIPSALENTVNTISAAVNGTRVKTASTLVKHITTVGGEPLVMFAKTGEWGGELYEDLVAPYLNSDLLCETWIRSPPLPSYCRPQYKFDVTNVQIIAASEEARWAETNDHSKWAVSVSDNYACIGDINRMASQAGRGGGTVCLRRKDVHSAMKDLVAATATCGNVH